MYQLCLEGKANMTTESNIPIVLNDEEAVHLNNLLNLNLDGQSGYKTAAEVLSNPDYAELFRQYAQARERNSTQLINLLQSSGYAADKLGSLPGLLRQGWLNLESLLTQGDAPIFAECERSDELTLAAYQDIMGQTTREDLMSILRAQFTDIRNAHTRVKALRAALEQVQR